MVGARSGTSGEGSRGLGSIQQDSDGEQHLGISAVLDRSDIPNVQQGDQFSAAFETSNNEFGWRGRRGAERFRTLFPLEWFLSVQ